MFGNIVQIIQAIAAGVLGPDRWKCSDNGVAGGKITDIDTGTSGSGKDIRAWVEFDYEDAQGQAHKVRGEGDLLKFGQRGGRDVIKVDGEDVDNDDVVTGVRYVMANPPIRPIIEFKFVKKTDSSIEPHRVRFDGLPDFSVLGGGLDNWD